jgi:hypothetical protein
LVIGSSCSRIAAEIAFLLEISVEGPGFPHGHQGGQAPAPDSDWTFEVINLNPEKPTWDLRGCFFTAAGLAEALAA